MSVPVVRSSRAAGVRELHDQTAGHAEEEHRGPRSPVAPSARPYSSRAFGSRRARGGHAAARPDRRDGDHFQDADPSPGHPGHGVPAFPDPLPGTHHYAEHDEALPHRPLDVGPADPYYSGGMAHGVPAPVHHGGRPAPFPEDRAAAEASRQAIAGELSPRPDPVPVVVVSPGGGNRPLRRAALRQVTVPAAGADPQVLVPRNPHQQSVRLLNESSAQSVTGSGAITAGAGNSSVTLPAGSTVTGFTITPIAGSGATTVVVTLTGLQGGTLTYNVPSPAASVPGFQVTFETPVPAAGPASVPTLTWQGNASSGAGSLNLYGTGVPPAVRLTADLAGGGGALLPAGMTSYVEITTADEICAYCPAGGPALISVISQYDVAGGT